MLGSKKNNIKVLTKYHQSQNLQNNRRSLKVETRFIKAVVTNTAWRESHFLIKKQRMSKQEYSTYVFHVFMYNLFCVVVPWLYFHPSLRARVSRHICLSVLLLPGQQTCTHVGRPTPTARHNCSGSKLYGEGLIQNLELFVSFHYSLNQRLATRSSVAAFRLDNFSIIYYY